LTNILSVVMLNFITMCFYDDCHYADCHYAECHYAECHFADCRGAKFWTDFWLLFDTDDKSKGLAPIFLSDHVTVV